MHSCKSWKNFYTFWWFTGTPHPDRPPKLFLAGWLCKHLGQGASGWLMGLGGTVKRKCVYTWLIHTAVQQKLTQYCKASILQWKSKWIKPASEKKKKKRWVERMEGPGSSKGPWRRSMSLHKWNYLQNYLKFSTLKLLDCLKFYLLFSSSLVPTLCDPMDWSIPGYPVLHRLPEFAQTHDHWVADA